LQQDQLNILDDNELNSLVDVSSCFMI